MKEKYVFVIDTDKYAGNFERELCAFATGFVGECDTGKEEAEKFINEFKLEEAYDGLFGEIIDLRVDENGCARPTSIWPTPGYFNNGLGSDYKDGEEEQALKDYNEYVKKDKKHSLKPRDKIEKYPAHNSVGIFFNERPTDEQITVLKERSKVYAKENDIDIASFRVVVERTTVDEESV